MDIGKLSEKLVDQLLDSTVEYKPSPDREAMNKRHLGYGIATTLGGIVLQSYPITLGGAAYSALKYYHVRKDREER